MAKWLECVKWIPQSAKQNSTLIKWEEKREK